MAIVGIGDAAFGVGTPGGGFTIAHTQPAGSNRVVLASVAYQSDTDVSGINYGAVAMTLIVEQTIGTLVVQMWGVLEVNLPADGALTITVLGSSGGSTAGVTLGTHSGVTQQYLPPPTLGGDTVADVNHEVFPFIHAPGDFVFWCQAKLGSVAYTAGQCPVGVDGLQIQTLFPTGTVHRTTRSTDALGETHTFTTARCVDDEVSTTFASIAVVMREAFDSGVTPTVISSGGPFTSVTISNVTPLQTLDSGSSNRLAYLLVQTIGNERVSSVNLGVQAAALLTDGTLDASDIIDSGADDLVNEVYVVYDVDIPAGVSAAWNVTLTGAQPSQVESLILRDAGQDNPVSLSIAAEAVATATLVDFGGTIVDFPLSIALAAIASGQ